MKSKSPMNIQVDANRFISSANVAAWLKMWFLILAAFFVHGRLFSQGLINNGARVVFTGNSSIILDGNEGNYTSQNGGFFSVAAATGGTIALSGNWVNNSSNSGFDNDGVTVAFNGSLPQAIAGIYPTKFYKLNGSGSGTKTFNTATSVSSLVTVEPNTILNANGNLTLLASASSVSSVGPLLSGAIISGNVNVQSYFTGGSSIYRGTRCISSPVNEAASPNNIYTQLKSFMVITGPGGTNNGFDIGSPRAPYGVTLTKYNEPAPLTQTQFSPVANIYETLSAGQGVFLFYRGNRDGYTAETVGTSNKVNAPYMIPESQVIQYVGPINQGDITVNLSYTDNPEDSNKGYNLIGNPYPAVIDWEGVSRTNVNNEIKLIKAGGGYITYMNNGFGSIVTPSDAVYARYIQPGQGFYVRANNMNASVTFTENSKSAASTPGRLLNVAVTDQLYFKGSGFTATKPGSSAPKLLRINLSDGVNTEESVVAFTDGAAAGAGFEDAVFFGGSTVSLSTLSSDNVKLTVNFMPPVSKVPEIKLSLTAENSGNLSLNFKEMSALENVDFFLKDNYLKTLIDVRSNPVYNFSIDKSVTDSYGDNRFSLIIPSVTILPVGLKSFEAEKGSNGVFLTWSVESEKDLDKYEIQRSNDESTFTSIGEVKATGAGKYSFNDINPENSINYYRLRQINNDGGFNYSNLVFIDYSLTEESAFSVYPNPVVKWLTVKMAHKTSPKLVINDLNGRELRNMTIAKGQPVQVDVADLPAGVYLLQIFDVEKNVQIGVSKFVKQGH